MVRIGRTRTSSVAFVVLAVALGSSAAAGPDHGNIDAARLRPLMMDNAYRLEGGRAAGFIIVDTRTREEYDRGHIFSAISIPEADFENSKDLLPKDKNTLVVVYGNGGSVDTSRGWAMKATAAGYTNVVIYSEGFAAWKGKKLPVAPL